MKFTQKDLEAAIEAGIFDKYNNVTTNPAAVIRYFERWAELKGKELAKNVRHKACDIVSDFYGSKYEINQIEVDVKQEIMNIQFEDVKPKQ